MIINTSSFYIFLIVHFTSFPAGNKLFGLTLSQSLDFSVSAVQAVNKSADECKIEKNVRVMKEDKSRFLSLNISTSEYTVQTFGNYCTFTFNLLNCLA
jgi:hypothetical protein